MLRPVPSRGLLTSRVAGFAVLVVACMLCLAPRRAAAQIHGVPPSVTSIQFHVPPFLPNAPPSVTSLGPRPVYNRSPYPQPYGVPRNLCAWGCKHRLGYGYGYNTGAYYAPIYATPLYDYSNADTGPYLYSGPPPDQTVHIVVDLPPDRRAAEADSNDDAAYAPPPRHEIEVRPLDATVLVFRDGHKQEVSNYAIMGQTVYIFDKRTQKIGLGDLDIPATIKLNDDRGVEFQLPSGSHS